MIGVGAGTGQEQGRVMAGQESCKVRAGLPDTYRKTPRSLAQLAHCPGGASRPLSPVYTGGFSAVEAVAERHGGSRSINMSHNREPK